jgi:hypothetical protein
LVVGCGSRTELDVGDGGGVVIVDAHPIDVHPVPDVIVPDDSPNPCVFPDIAATIMTTADDQFLLYVNDQQIGGNSDWGDAQQYSVMIHRDPGKKNVIAIQGTNLQNTDGRDRGVLLDMRFVTEAGQQTVVTTSKWRLATGPNGNWWASTLDDSSWTNAVSEGLYPEGPWNNVFSKFGLGSNAEWLWSYDSNKPSSAKVVTETIYVRRDFYIDASGHVVDAPSPCD